MTCVLLRVICFWELSLWSLSARNTITNPKTFLYFCVTHLNPLPSCEEVGKYLSSYHSSLAGKILSNPKVSDYRETHSVRNPTAPMLLLQVALESLGNLVGGGSGASKS